MFGTIVVLICGDRVWYPDDHIYFLMYRSDWKNIFIFDPPNHQFIIIHVFDITSIWLVDLL